MSSGPSVVRTGEPYILSTTIPSFTALAQAVKTKIEKQSKASNNKRPKAFFLIVSLPLQ